MRTKYYLIIAVFTVITVVGRLIGTVLWSFLFVFQTVDDVLDIYLNPRKNKKSILLRIAIVVIAFKVMLTGSIPDAWRIIAGTVFVIGYGSGLVVMLMADYIKMVVLASKLSQSVDFVKTISGLSTTGAKQLVLCQHGRGAQLQEVESGDFINKAMAVEILLKKGLPDQVNCSASYQKSLVAMAMMIAGVSEITVLDYNKDYSIMRMENVNVRTKIDRRLVKLAKKMGYAVVWQRKTRVRPNQQQRQIMFGLLVDYINKQWADLPAKKLLAKFFRSRRDLFFIQYYSRIVSFQGDRPQSILGNEPRRNPEKFINCSDLTVVESAFEKSGAQAVLPSLDYGRQELFLAAVIKTGKSCFISNVIGYKGFVGGWETTEVKPGWKMLWPMIQAILSGYHLTLE